MDDDNSFTDSEDFIDRRAVREEGDIPILDAQRLESGDLEPPLMVAGDDVLKRAAAVRVQQCFEAHPKVVTEHGGRSKRSRSCRGNRLV